MLKKKVNEFEQIIYSLVNKKLVIGQFFSKILRVFLIILIKVDRETLVKVKLLIKFK